MFVDKVDSFWLGVREVLTSPFVQDNKDFFSFHSYNRLEMVVVLKNSRFIQFCVIVTELFHEGINVCNTIKLEFECNILSRFNMSAQ